MVDNLLAQDSLLVDYISRAESYHELCIANLHKTKKKEEVLRTANIQMGHKEELMLIETDVMR